MLSLLDYSLSILSPRKSFDDHREQEGMLWIALSLEINFVNEFIYSLTFGLDYIFILEFLF